MPSPLHPPSSPPQGRPPKWSDVCRTITLWHGTISDFLPTIIAKVNPSKCARATDFGRGFYRTTYKNQAEEWARKAVDKRRVADPRNEIPQLPPNFCEGYWSAVVEELVEHGMKKTVAQQAVAGDREFMKRASWTIYNDQVTESARMAKEWLKNWGGGATHTEGNRKHGTTSNGVRHQPRKKSTKSKS
jgi:hypothetical protein